MIDLLRAKKILVTHGTGFNWFEPDHFRLVTLPDVERAGGGDRPDRRLPRHPALSAASTPRRAAYGPRLTPCAT